MGSFLLFRCTWHSIPEENAQLKLYQACLSKSSGSGLISSHINLPPTLIHSIPFLQTIKPPEIGYEDTVIKHMTPEDLFARVDQVMKHVASRVVITEGKKNLRTQMTDESLAAVCCAWRFTQTRESWHV